MGKHELILPNLRVTSVAKICTQCKNTQRFHKKKYPSQKWMQAIAQVLDTPKIEAVPRKFSFGHVRISLKISAEDYDRCAQNYEPCQLLSLSVLSVRDRLSEPVPIIPSLDRRFSYVLSGGDWVKILSRLAPKRLINPVQGNLCWCTFVFIAGCIGCSSWVPLNKDYPGALSTAAKEIPVSQFHGTRDEVVRFTWGQHRSVSLLCLLQ